MDKEMTNSTQTVETEEVISTNGYVNPEVIEEVETADEQVETSEQEEVDDSEEQEKTEWEQLQERVEKRLVVLRDCKYRDGVDGKLRNLSQAKCNYRVLDYMITNHDEAVTKAVEYVESNAEEVITERKKLGLMVEEFNDEQLAQFRELAEKIRLENLANSKS